MFSTISLFKSVACPYIHDCNVVNCIFLHDQPHTLSNVAIYDPAAVDSSVREDEPPPKRRRLLGEVPQASSTPAGFKPFPAQASVPKENITPTTKPRAVRPVTVTTSLKTKSLIRDVSPPPKRRIKPVVKTELVEEKLIPRLVPQAPAVLKTRLSLVEMLYKHMKVLNQQAVSEDSPAQSSLSDQELIRIVLDEEEAAALKLGSDIYRNAMSQQVLRFKKMNTQQWQKYVTQQLEKRQANPHPNNSSKTPETVRDPTKEAKAMDTKLEVAMLQQLQTKLEGLERFGYVTQPPSPDDIEKAKLAVKSSAGYEVCDRCTTRFQCFPGRNDRGELTTRGKCNYHWARIDKSRTNKQIQMFGVADATYLCCNQLAGSEGCTTAPTHVFKVTDTKRLAALLQYETTPRNARPGCPAAVAFDCEMGYTTQGLELIRLTAISWPNKKELLDVLVRPYGEVLDLNTRFSGVTPEQFNTAPAYQIKYTTAETKGITESAELQKVDSPAAARQLLFELLTPETPLIGHAIDNDLNTCRIIHPFIVDTVLLYPHPRGLPIRYSLKVLSSKYLDRAIQTGGAQGHDSKEDSMATGDLVRAKVAERWEELLLKGWRFEGGSLKQPASMAKKTG